MKRYFSFLAVLCITWQVAANHHHANQLSIISEEIISTETTFSLRYYLKTTEAIHIQSHQLTLPPGVSKGSVSLPSMVAIGDSVLFTISLTYDKYRVSFFARTICLQLNLTNGEQLRNEAKLYFTPWGTVEALSHPDFYGNPKRRWLGTQATSDSTRITLQKANIPVSDVDFNSSEEQKVMWVSLPGLAYEILMSEEKAANYLHYSGDDQPLPTNARVSGFLCADKKGTVRGRLMQRYNNDLGIDVEFPLQHIHVRLRDEDPFLDDQLGTTYTDAQGNFEINYETCQLNEGDLELFLEFVAKTPANIQALTAPTNINIFNLDGNQVQEKVNVGKAGNNFNRDMGQLFLNDNAFVTVHRANQCYLFSQPHLPRSKGLDILVYQNYNNSFYLPDKYVLSSLTPKIFLKDGREIGETTIYHEYGHHVFYLMTNYGILPLYDNQSGSHSDDEDNHPYAAFNEGWADAFHYIMDAHRRLEDGECGRVVGNDGWPEHEVLDEVYITLFGDYRYTNGLKSEYLIGAAIYDLWDGPDKGLPLNATREFPGYDDVNVSLLGTQTVPQGSWSPGNEDDVSLSLVQILKGLEGNPTNVYDYFRNLVTKNGFTGIGCNQQLNNIEKIFRNNWVVRDIPAYRAGLGSHMAYYIGDFSGTHLDLSFGYVPTLSKTWLAGNIFQGILPFQYYTIDYNWGETNEIVPGDFLTVNENYERINQPILINRRDDETIRRTITFTGVVDYELCPNLSITVDHGVLDLQNEGEFIISGESILEGTARDTEINVGENTRLVIYDGGILRLGEEGSRINLRGELHIFPGGTLSLGDENSGINVLGNGKIVIHPGAYVCVNGDLHMSFSTSMAEQLEFSTYNLGVHPNWQNRFGNAACWKITQALGSSLGLTLFRTNQITCNTTNFGYQITGPQLPNDAQICWYFPSTWSSWVTAQNCTPWVTNANGTVNNWQQGNYQGGEVSVIVKANGKIQELTDVVPSSTAPQLAVVAPANFTGELDVCSNNSLVVQTSGGTSPYQFDWKNHWNLNHEITNETTKSTLLLKTDQWVFDLQKFEVTATDNKGCVSNKVPMSVRPSVNVGWIPRPLNYPESANTRSLASEGRINNDFALSKHSERIYFTDNANNLRYTTFDSEKLAWVFSEVLAPNSAGSVELFEDASEAVVYFKSVSKKVQSVRFDKVSNTWAAPITYPSTDHVSSQLFVNNQKELFYRNTANELIRVLPNNTPLVLATNVTGVNLLQVDQKLFYITSDGRVNYIDLTTNLPTTSVGLMAKNETMIKADSKKNIYYINTQSNFQMIPFDGVNYGASVALSYKQPPSTAWALCTGYFDINKKSDVIYYNGGDRALYQLYQKPSGEWQSVLSNYYGNDNAYGHVEYRFPHAFYMSKDYIYNLFYSGEGCDVLQRQGISEFDFGESTAFVTFPNPTQNHVVIQLKETTLSGKFELISSIGEVLFSNEINNTRLEWNLESVSSGIYLVVLRDNQGEIIQTEKLMVLE